MDVQIKSIDGAFLGKNGEGQSFDFSGELCPAPRLAVVGSRAAHRRSVEVARLAVAVAHELGWSLVSGGAYGIDIAGHREALALGCPQLAVLPGPCDQVYPPDHESVFAQISTRKQSGVLFAQPEGMPFQKWMFASRNKWILAAAKAVFVVQASSRSGSAGTGRSALSMGIATAGLTSSKGCLQLIEKGARSIDPNQEDSSLESSLRRWMKAIEEGKECTSPEEEWPATLTWLRDRIQSGEGGVLDLNGAGGDVFALLSAVTQAEAEGLVYESTPGRYILRR